jgi:hypothetical protein
LVFVFRKKLLNMFAPLQTTKTEVGEGGGVREECKGGREETPSEVHVSWERRKKIRKESMLERSR